MELIVSRVPFLACIRFPSFQYILLLLISTFFFLSAYCSERLDIFYEQLAQGGTAVGTGLNTKKG